VQTGKSRPFPSGRLDRHRIAAADRSRMDQSMGIATNRKRNHAGTTRRCGRWVARLLLSLICLVPLAQTGDFLMSQRLGRLDVSSHQIDQTAAADVIAFGGDRSTDAPGQNSRQVAISPLDPPLAPTFRARRNWATSVNLPASGLDGSAINVRAPPVSP